MGLAEDWPYSGLVTSVSALVIRAQVSRQDCRGPFLFIRCRAVFSDFSVRSFVLDLIPNEGLKAFLISVRDSTCDWPGAGFG